MSLFKGFVDMERIPKKVIYYNFLWLAACVTGLTIFGKFIVVLLFTEKFLPTVPLILPLALASFFRGMYQPYMMFISAHEKGKWMRNMSFIMSMVNFLGNIILIPIWGAYGAAVASVIGNGSFYFSCLRYYRIYRRQR